VRASGHGDSFERTAARQKVFRFGTNHIELEVVKKPNVDGKPCNVSDKPNQYTGVSFTIFGELGTDLSLPPQEKEKFVRLPEGSLGGGNVQLDFEVRNNGPGGLARVPLFISLDAPVTGEPQGTYLKVSSPQPPIEDCKATPPVGYSETHPRTIQCTIVNFRPGASATQHVEIAFFAQPGGGRTPLYVRWSAFGANEPPGSNFTDNERTKTIWLCRYDDPGEECGPK
jgi:hypothetical protein